MFHKKNNLTFLLKKAFLPSGAFPWRDGLLVTPRRGRLDPGMQGAGNAAPAILSCTGI